MLARVALPVAALLLAACVHGPALGRATDVVVTSRVVTEDREGICRRFEPTARDAARFLNSAVIITAHELHYAYQVGPCHVRGTARFRGMDAKWEMNVLGTGWIILADESEYRIADERQRDGSE